MKNLIYKTNTILTILILVFGIQLNGIFACPHHGDSQASQEEVVTDVADKVDHHAQMDIDELEEFVPQEDEEAAI